MALSAPVAIESKAGTTVLTMNMPEAKNRISPAFRAALIEALQSANEDSSTNVVVITGTDGCFSSGGDLSSMHERDPVSGRDRMDDAHKVTRLIQYSPKPMIAAVDGIAYGAGFSIALACDQIVATERSSFCSVYARAALLPDYGMLHLLPARVGIGRAKRLMMLSSIVPADEAERIGIVDRLVAPGEALEEAMRLADEFRQVAPLPTMLIKRTLAQGRCETLEQAFATELDLQPLLLGSEDFSEAADAFVNRRKPRFQGR